MVRAAQVSDPEVIARIYNHYIATTVVTFEEVGYKFDRWIDVGYWQGRLSRETATDGREER